jgi:acylglycerol lipase
MMLRLFLLGLLALTSACAPLKQGALQIAGEPAAGFSESWFTSFDGARLGLNTWMPQANVEEPGFGPSATEPEIVVIAIHGMNDYASAFNAAGAWWSAQGAVVYAYDQRGFGRSPRSGIWPDHDVMRKDLATAVDIARQRHPDARIAVVGESMGASVAITAFADGDPPEADVLILSGPGLRGWGTLPWLYSASLWTSAHVRPSWVVVPPKGLNIVPTDNIEKLREMWLDPHVQKSNRIDSVYGVVSIMDEADAKISRLPAKVPTLLLYGAHDQIIPPDGLKRAAKKLPAHVKTAYYAKGYHMLMNDLQAETVWRDVLSFIEQPSVVLPSASPPLPWAPKPPSNR